MARKFPGVAFERYVDDAVIHCVSEGQAREVLAALQARMSQVGLALHPDKTRGTHTAKKDERHDCGPVVSAPDPAVPRSVCVRRVNSVVIAQAGVSGQPAASNTAIGSR